MTYQVLARKWRPQSFEDVVGQETVTRILENAIRSGRIAHAFLFCGVRGVGKTTTARILAKALNCREGLSPNPCGRCDACLEIAASSSVDVQEIDAASNSGVDNIRELRESVKYGTARDRFKVYIVDEAHMLSNSAFNALLKTLEEPPAHVKFILATTEYHKIPVTIASRCLELEFKPIPTALILERLTHISREEGFDISEYALATIASAAEGSLRDAQSTLEKIISFGGDGISDEDLRVILGVVDERLLASVVEKVLEGDRKGLIVELRGLAEHGLDSRLFCQKLAAYLRHLLVCKLVGWDPSLLQLPDSHKEALLRQSEKFSRLDLIRLYDLISRTDGELKWSPRPHLHLEMALMKCVELKGLPELEKILGRLEQGEWDSVAETAPPEVNPRSKRGGTDSQTEGGKLCEASEAPPAAVEMLSVQGADQVVSRLLSVLQMEGRFGLVESLQKAGRLEYRDGTLSVFFPAEEKVHYNIVSEPDKLKILQKSCASITGQPVKVEVRQEENGGLDSAASSPGQDPGVKAVMKRFPGKIVVERNLED